MMGVGTEKQEENAAGRAVTPKDDKKAARFLYNAANWLGINWVFNSSLSLWVTYNTLPTNTAKAGIRGLGKWVFKPVAIGMDKVKGLFGKSTLEKMSEAEKEFKIIENSRSTAEIFCMFVAGSIALIPMMFIEKRKDKIINWFDGLLHPSKKHEQHTETGHEEKAPTQSLNWGKLLQARVLGMIAILGINQAMQTYNNKHPNDKWFNSDVAETRLGGWLFEKLPENVRRKVIWVFSGFSKNKVNVESIQVAMRERAFKDAPEELQIAVKRLAKINTWVENNPELETAKGFSARKKKFEELRTRAEPAREKIRARIAEHPQWNEPIEKAIFSEQTRLFSKEVSLTLAITGIMYVLAKTPLISKTLEVCRLKKKKSPVAESTSEMLAENTTPPETVSPPEERTLPYAARVTPREKTKKPSALYTEQLANEPGQAAAPSL